MNTNNYIDPISPGEILLEDFMEPLHIGKNKLAHDLFISPNEVSEIIHGNKGISVNVALRSR